MADIKWIKIKTDIFDDEKILLIETLPDSYAIITVWFKLLCLAGKQNNKGVFLLNDRIAYTDDMLAVIFRMNKNTVTLALNTFEEFGMIDRINGAITIPNWEKHQNLDALERNKEYHKNYMKKKREEQKKLCDVNSDVNSEVNCDVSCDVTVNGAEYIYKNKNKNKNKNIYIYFQNEELNNAFIDFIEMRKKIKAPMTTKAIQLAISKLEKMTNGDEKKMLELINDSVLHSWKSFYDDKPKKDDKRQQSSNRFNNFTQRDNDFYDMEKRLLT